MNAVVVAVLIMLILSLFKIHVVISLIIGAIVGGLTAGFGLLETVEIFTGGLGGKAQIALEYGMLGGFAIAISKTGLPKVFVDFMINLVGREGEGRRKTLSKVLLLLAILTVSIFSQNVIPVHIAFIPILIPPLLQVLNELKVDRRGVATAITFGLKAPYILLPFGFGYIFHGIIVTNMEQSGMSVLRSDIPKAMLIPTLGMVVGLVIALFFTYRKQRTYENVQVATEEVAATVESEVVGLRAVIVSIIAIIAVLAAQYRWESMILSALSVLLFYYSVGN